MWLHAVVVHASIDGAAFLKKPTLPAPILEIIKKPPAMVGNLKSPIIELGPHHFDGARICCQAMTAQCLACKKGMRTEDVCERMPHFPGCTRHGPPVRNPMQQTLAVPPTVHQMPLLNVLGAPGKMDKAGKLVEDVEKYVAKNPGVLQNATKKALNDLSKMLSHKHRAKTPMVPRPRAVVAASVPQKVEEVRWIQSPWVIAGIATAFAAACTGVATGVLCFVRLQRVQIAREPLLAGALGTAADATTAMELAS